MQGGGFSPLGLGLQVGVCIQQGGDDGWVAVTRGRPMQRREAPRVPRLRIGAGLHTVGHDRRGRGFKEILGVPILATPGRRWPSRECEAKEAQRHKTFHGFLRPSPSTPFRLHQSRQGASRALARTDGEPA